LLERSRKITNKEPTALAVDSNDIDLLLATKDMRILTDPELWTADTTSSVQMKPYQNKITDPR
jgi:hypothetical protein